MADIQKILVQTSILFVVLCILFLLMNRNIDNMCMNGKPVLSFYVMFFLALFIIALSSIIVEQKEHISDNNFNFAVVFLINAIFVVIASLYFAFTKPDVKNQLKRSTNRLKQKF